MKGIYYCKNCKLMVMVLTKAKVHKTMRRFSIDKCPHCNGTIKEETLDRFISFKYKVWLKLSRIYSYRHIGKKRIDLSVKFSR